MTREEIAAALMASQGYIQPGVPQGLEGTPGPDQAELLAMEEARKNTPLTMRDVGGAALWALQGAGDVASAFPMGQGAAFARGPVMETARHLFQSRLPALYEKLGGRAAAEADIPGAKKAFDESAEYAESWFGYKPPAPKGATAHELRDRTMDIERFRADAEIAAAQRGGRPGAPVVDGLSAQKEAELIEAFIKSNKGQIKGPDGKRLTKAQQRELVSEWLAQGGRLPEAGPWGRDIRADTLDAINAQIGKRKP